MGELEEARTLREWGDVAGDVVAGEVGFGKGEVRFGEEALAGGVDGGGEGSAFRACKRNVSASR